MRATKLGLGAEGHGERVERRVDRAHRRRLGDLAELGGGRVLALGQAVDPVVEQQDRQVDVAAQGVDQVVAADRQAVAVAGDDPHVEVGAGDGDAGGDRRGATVDRVHPVGVHVVREAARAADAGDEHRVLGRDAELGHQLLDGEQDAVVAAAGAPADLLVAGPVLLRRQGDGGVGHRAELLLDGVLDLAGGERQPLDLRQRPGVDEVLGADDAGQLALVELGDEHLRVAPQRRRRGRGAAG